MTSPSLLGGRSDLPIAVVAALMPTSLVLSVVARTDDSIHRTTVRPTPCFDAALITGLLVCLSGLAWATGAPTLGRDAAFLTGLALTARLVGTPSAGVVIPTGYLFLLFVLGRPSSDAVPVWAIPLRPSDDAVALGTAGLTATLGLILLAVPRLRPPWVANAIR